MGGAFAKNLAAAGWRVVGYDISAARRREAARAGVEIADSAADVAAEAPIDPHQPAQAVGAHGHRAQDRRRQTAAQAAGGNEHLRDFRQGKGRARPRQGRPRHARHAGQRHRRRRRATRDLVFYASGDSRAIKRLQPMFAGLRPPRLRRRRLRQRQQDEIRRQPSGRDQQRRQRRGHGAGHEGRAAAAN